jgi:hypothetical protein
MNTTRASISLALLLSLAACGSGGDRSADAAPVEDTTIKPLPREPLGEADLVGLEMVNLSVELPWTTNRVERNPGPAAPRSMVESLAVSAHESFDRAVFTFSSDAPFPGYTIELYEPGAAIPCGDIDETEQDVKEHAEGIEGEASEVEYAPELEGNRFLVLRLRPAWVSENGRTTLPIEVEQYGQTRILEAGVTCAQEDVVTWIAGLDEGSQLRVLEMRSPQRLVLDVR